MTEFESFKRKVTEQGLNKPKEPLYWFFVSAIEKESGAFVGGVFMQATHWMKATEPALTMVWATGLKGVTFQDIVQIPDDKLPADQYRNRVLTLAEVREIWPWVHEPTTSRN